MRWDAAAAGPWQESADAARDAEHPRAAAQRAGARVPRADVPRGPVEERAQPRARRVGDAVPVDDQSVPGLLPACVYCFARRTHEWLEFDSGLDFDSQIVVKTNLVEVLRKELARPSWKREHVALGTNTDPYQRAEGRYRLMPGVIGALADSGTPFSILTKGTLLRRDIPLLVEAARRSRSGSASPWRSGTTPCTRPSSPACRHREHASTWSRRSPTPVCRAGSSSHPCCPASRTAPPHLDAALGAIAAAGATGVTVIPLHLRPGAREWFMAWLPRPTPSWSRATSSSTPAGPTCRPSTASGCSNGSPRC